MTTGDRYDNNILVIKGNVKLKNEMGVSPQDYWKNTHKALKRISERLVKLANKIGQLY